MEANSELCQGDSQATRYHAWGVYLEILQMQIRLNVVEELSKLRFFSISIASKTHVDKFWNKNFAYKSLFTSCICQDHI
jgi:hypothetical protein